MAAIKATENSELVPVPVLTCRYKDGEHQMVTITAVVCSEALAAQIAEDTGFKEWPFRSTDWTTVVEIKVPQLSAKEQATITHLMKTSEDAYRIHEEMGIQFDDRQGESISLLRNYLQHYRRYPAFSRVQ